MTLDNGENNEVSCPQEKGAAEVTTNKHPPDPDSDKDLCPICSSPSLSSCRNCKKVSYCGKPHQRKHWKAHKKDCFPLIHQYDEILGSRLISTRNIKPGEIIWREEPLLCGPTIWENNPLILTTIKNGSISGSGINNCEEKAGNSGKPMCLGCFAVVKSDYLCPSCCWPACGPQCIGNGSEHCELECKIFTSQAHENTVKQLPFHLDLFGESQCNESSYNKYGAITILRGVLLKEKDPPKWKKILELDEMWNGKECDNFQKRSLASTPFGQFCHEFIMRLNPSNVRDEDIQLLLRVICYRKFAVYEQRYEHLVESEIQATYLFYTVGQAIQNCVPNCSWIIQHDTNEIHLRALQPIQFGRTVSLSYANVTKGIMDRQAWLGLGRGESSSSTGNSFANPYYYCECERCKDSSELGTFFSTIKCPDCQEDKKEINAFFNLDSWLLPTVVQGKVQENGNKIKELMWKCHECGGTKSFEFYMQVVTSVNNQVCDTFKSNSLKFRTGDDACFASSQLIENLEMLCTKYSSVSVHPNHFLMFQIESEILNSISHQLTMFNGHFNEKWTLLVERFTQLCRKWLEVADVLWPGLSPQRGKLLYFYQQALTFQLMLSITQSMRCGFNESDELKDFFLIERTVFEKQFFKILSIRKVVLEVFCFHPSESVEGKYAQSMVQTCSEIEILKRYVFPTQNNHCNRNGSL